jgi:hypothetical protein
MLFLFKDKQQSIKQLGIIIETKKLSSLTLKLRESLNANVLMEDILLYEDEKTLNSDIKRLFTALLKHADQVNQIQKEKQIGFLPSAEGHFEEGDPDEDCD